MEPDKFSLSADHPLRAEHEMLSAVMREAQTHDTRIVGKLETLESFRAILAADAPGSVRIARAAAERAKIWFSTMFRDGVWSGDTFAMVVPGAVLIAIARRKFAWPPHERAELLDLIPDWNLVRALLPGEGSPIPDELRAALVRVRQRIPAPGQGGTKPLRALAAKIDDLLSENKQAVFDPGEPWTEAPQAQLAREPWTAWGRHLLDAESTKLSKKWQDEAVRLTTAIGEEAVRSSGTAWLASVCDGSQLAVSPRNGNFVRGLVWCLARDGGAESARRVGDVAAAMSKKIRNVGMRSVKVLNACVALLGEMDHPEAMAQLSRLRTKIKASQVSGLIERTMAAAAARRGITTAELEDMVVPTFGMEPETGAVRQTVGAYTAEVRIASLDRVELTWRTATGSAQKSVPAEVKRDHAEELAGLKRLVKDVGSMLSAQRERIEQMLLAERVVPFHTWLDRYFGNPIMNQLTRRLIWHFENGERSVLGAYETSCLAVIDVDDEAILWLDKNTRVRLWHPIGFPVETIQAWRQWLERHETVQPFKQAHREIYIITDAELATRRYSNRFAQHIVRQHQFAALCKARGWRYRLQGAFDGANNPVIELPERGLCAEYFVAPCETEGTEAISPYASTDQVRFVSNAGEPLELSEVPALVFSEIMRDVDLFVGVSSVGTDPTWADAGHRETWNHYWRAFAFGELSQTAETRRAVIERLLPRLAIASRTRIDGRFLVVHGDLRTYKIHLGSGNILMEPNDQYLCIVPDWKGGPQQQAGRVWVPFEGDGTLSVILSKAFLLAADTKITDQVILRQIGAK